mmetsp:Transcript_814/g.1849  ORF Transcript_814/g.1849 Transcript_814/m.1849 type:complete len:203 (-) Transcript_814:848-1456(-)
MGLGRARRSGELVNAEPRLVEGSLDADAFTWVHFHQLADEILCLLRNLRELGNIELPAAILDLCVEALILERWHTTQHDVKNDSETPHVDLLAIARAGFLGCANHLGSKVLWRPTECAAVHGLLVDARKPEICKLGDHRVPVLVGEENVFRLQVSVYERLRDMEVLHGATDLAEDTHRLHLSQAASIHQVVQKISARDTLQS